jgi:hypothetical protein
MAFLSNKEYKNLWTAAPNGFGKKIGDLPCYHEYLQREIYKQDYLDLFIYQPTFERTLLDNKYYVKITDCKMLIDLDIPDCVEFVLKHNNEKYLLVDYKYPWTKSELTEKKRCIKYAMIGEVAPSNMSYFFYYVLQLQNIKTLNKNTNGEIVKDYKGYVTAPFIAFFGGDAESCNNNDKKEILIKFANKGVVLLDIFPFAFTYDPKIRYSLNNNGKTKNYFKKLIEENFNGKEDIKGVFIAPPIISHFLAIEVNNGLKTPISFRKEINTFNPPHITTTSNDPLKDFFFHKIPCSTKVIGKEEDLPQNTENPLITIQVPKFICCGYSGAMTVPHALFITNALL